MEFDIRDIPEIVDVGTLLELRIDDELRGPQVKKLLVAQPIPYRDLLEEIRKERVLESKSVMNRLAELLIERRYALEPEVMQLCIGESGRPSTAVMGVYRSKLNPDAISLREVVNYVEGLSFSIPTQEGILVIMRVPDGEVLGEITIHLSIPNGVALRAFVEILGPIDTDLDEQVTALVESEIVKKIGDMFPYMYISTRVSINRSELS